MSISARALVRLAMPLMVIGTSVAVLSSCASPTPKSMVANKSRSKEYFAESEYGVKASPRVSWKKSNLPRGGGRDQTGKPYKVHGKMYYPKEDKHYRKTGRASWYGDAFHGRLTANGEIYDSTHLTAAHPTMPLPSYARVTNVENGNSVIVRVNDRGPYSDDRLIDLSSRAADLLDYKRIGTAKVKVEYVGRAPLDGVDDSYLLASYRPGNKAADPSDGLPTGVMVAMNGPTPDDDAGGATPAFPGVLDNVATGSAPVMTASFDGATDLVLPAFGPIVPQRPVETLQGQQLALATMSYAPQTSSRAAQAFAALEGQVASPGQPLSTAALQQDDRPFVAAATVSDESEARRLLWTLSAFGRAKLDATTIEGETLYSVNVYEDGRASLDDILEGAWQHGAPDAIVVRD